MIFRKREIVIIICFLTVINSFPISTMAVLDDITPPITNYFLDPSEPDGLGDYYVSNVTITLIATDESGINKTFYRINSEEWLIYNTTFVLFEDGNDILVEFYSIDNVGNIEEVKSFTVNIDQTPPKFTPFIWDIENNNGSWLITFDFKAIDDTSGIDRIELYINEGLWATITDEGPTYTFQMEWSDAFSTVVFTFVIYNGAGLFTEVPMRFPLFKGFIFGRIDNLTPTGDSYKFNVVELRVIRLLPFSNNIFNSGETVAIFGSLFKILTNSFIAGYMKILIVNIYYNNSKCVHKKI